MWLAHTLTLVRLPLALAFWALYGRPPWPIVIVALAAISDWLDGWVARRVLPHGSSIGGWLDPLADKVFVVVALVAVYVHTHPPAALIALAGARELAMAPLATAAGLATALGWRAPYPLRASVLGKIATVAQFVAVLAVVAGVDRLAWPAAGLAAVTGLAAVAQYVVRALHHR
jgi:phosphatidylglycerophosphate synthase